MLLHFLPDYRGGLFVASSLAWEGGRVWNDFVEHLWCFVEQQKLTGHKLNNAKLNQEMLNLLKKDPRAQRGGSCRHSLQMLKQSHEVHSAACTLNPKVTINNLNNLGIPWGYSLKEERFPGEKNSSSSICSSSFRFHAARWKQRFPSSHPAQHLCGCSRTCQGRAQPWGL